MAPIEEPAARKSWLSRECFHHPVYEWLNVFSTLFVPLVVGILTVVLPLQQQSLSERQNENSKTIAINSRMQDMDMLHDQQRQMVLNTYEHDLSQLLFKYSSIKHGNGTSNFSASDDDDDDKHDDGDDKRVSMVIRVKTLHALRQLDPARKILLIQLLMDSGVQTRISISHADFSSLIFPPGSFYNHLQLVNVIARSIKLQRVSLHQSNFSQSILDEALFLESNCSQADFSYASLQRTDWTGTDVSRAMFNHSNLFGAKITAQQLSTVGSLQGAVLPNGSTAIV